MPENTPIDVSTPEWGTQWVYLLQRMERDNGLEVPIHTPDEVECGYFRWKLITAEQEMWPKEFPFHRQQIPIEAPFPIAFLDSIDVRPEFRGRKLGTKGLMEFLSLTREKGARLGYLRLGWNGTDEDRDWKLAWYRRHGWVELRNSDPNCQVPFMFHTLIGQGSQ